MGVHAHDFEAAEAAPSGPAAAAAGPGLNPETNLEFLSRRALEESRLAREARSAKAAAAHRYLAAAYSAEIARELATAASFQALLRDLP